jgi:hypothetical protein
MMQRSDSTNTTRARVATRTSRSMPSPPRVRPGPPESVRSAVRSMTSGNSFSIDSTGWIDEKSPSSNERNADDPSASR